MYREIEECRKRIDKVDQDLLQLLNERAKLVVKLGNIKKKLRLPLRDRAREKYLIDRLQQENCGPLDGSAVSKIFRLIIHELRQIEGDGSKKRFIADAPSHEPSQAS